MRDTIWWGGHGEPCLEQGSRGLEEYVGEVWGHKHNNKSPEFVIINEKWLFLSSAVLMIILYHRTNLSSDSTFQWYECKPEFWPEPELVCVRLNRREEKKQTGQRQPRNRDSVGSSIVGNKLIPTSREPMGVGETPGLFPGKQSSISSSTPQNLSLPLSLSLSMSLSLSLSYTLPCSFLAVLRRREMMRWLTVTSLPWQWRANQEKRREREWEFP